MEVLAMILAGGRGSRLDILSQNRVKPSVPFAGKFRIIDFALSNCSNSGIYNVALLTQYLPLSLNEHIGAGKPWDLDRRDTSVTLLQPFQNASGTIEWYHGTADAIRQNIRFIHHQMPKYVLILSGDHIYKMNYSKMLENHKKNGASLTVAVHKVPENQAKRFGILGTDETNRITSFEEKPSKPKSNLASMGIYIFNTEILLDYLLASKQVELDFGKDIIPEMLKNNEKVYAHYFEGYWMDIGTYESYHEANLDLIKKSEEVGINLYDKNWKIYTKSINSAPVRIGETGSIINSLVCDGCKIEGRVENSVLGPGVTVRVGSTVTNSIIFEGTYVSENAHIDYAIIDKYVNIGKFSLIGYGDDYTHNIEKPDLLYTGLSVLGKNTMVGDNVIIGRNIRIYSNMKIDSNTKIKSGETIK
ncbi:glucose-1-phosphate adenylyltransferase [Sneathia vaginalis]|uniref:glucose-1-phosphate adenylyltransferase n=1 Tax=Sneathia vaginalis TaxID=187101 RepID=UPI0035C6D066